MGPVLYRESACKCNEIVKLSKVEITDSQMISKCNRTTNVLETFLFLFTQGVDVAR